MPKRRAIGRGLTAAADALAPALSSWVGGLRQDKQNTQILDRQKQLDLLNRKQKLSDDVATGTKSPEQAGNIWRAETGQEEDFASFQPSLTDRVAGISKDIGAAHSLSELPTEQRIRRRMTELDVPQDQPDAMVPGPSSVHGFPLVASTKPSEQASSLMDELGATRTNLQAQVPSTPYDYKDTRGLARRGFKPSNQLAGLDVATDATPEQTSQLDLDKLLADAGNQIPEHTGINKGTAHNAEVGLTGPVDATQAGRVADAQNASQLKYAGATADAQRRGQLQAEMASMGLTNQQQQAAMQLADDFASQSKEFYTTEGQFRRLATFARTGTAASDLAMVYAFMKMQDPNSSVMQNEQATAQNASAVPDQIRNLYNAMMTGAKLTPEQRMDFLARGKQAYTDATTDHQRRIVDFSGRASTLHVPASLVIRQPDAELGKSALEALRERP